MVMEHAAGIALVHVAIRMPYYRVRHSVHCLHTAAVYHLLAHGLGTSSFFADAMYAAWNVPTAQTSEPTP